MLRFLRRALPSRRHRPLLLLGLLRLLVMGCGQDTTQQHAAQQAAQSPLGGEASAAAEAPNLVELVPRKAKQLHELLSGATKLLDIEVDLNRESICLAYKEELLRQLKSLLPEQAQLVEMAKATPKEKKIKAIEARLSHLYIAACTHGIDLNYLADPIFPFFEPTVNFEDTVEKYAKASQTASSWDGLLGVLATKEPEPVLGVNLEALFNWAKEELDVWEKRGDNIDVPTTTAAANLFFPGRTKLLPPRMTASRREKLNRILFGEGVLGNQFPLKPALKLHVTVGLVKQQPVFVKLYFLAGESALNTLNAVEYFAGCRLMATWKTDDAIKVTKVTKLPPEKTEDNAIYFDLGAQQADSKEKSGTQKQLKYNPPYSLRLFYKDIGLPEFKLELEKQHQMVSLLRVKDPGERIFSAHSLS